MVRRENRSIENTNTQGNGQSDAFAEFFEAFMDAPPTFTFYISIGTPTVDISVISPMEIPIFVNRRSAQTETSRNTAAGTPSQFFSYIQELIDSIRRRERIKKELIRNKPYVFTKDMETKDCTVCLSEFKHKQRIRRLDCDHEFHKKCIDKWLLQGNSCCPLCRKEPFLKKYKEK
ncbi:uncharacterized protein VICG_00415 [Vittaforma corneae ATCC 50505]|uniref:RING-type domain-containing protein n=1 Tax=Vittaforma corneae (strain ATCC 50505) TaxID=993615 RepID=L2GP55_VITCO|nr:uncharacterized protein VICG_00415 [Vittaforma corneae ATCC 50505]ELA42663.1 hypothetical protein VICG_00415 [Vittaforma corneae ATCC 50505]